MAPMKGKGNQGKTLCSLCTLLHTEDPFICFYLELRQSIPRRPSRFV